MVILKYKIDIQLEQEFGPFLQIININRLTIIISIFKSP